MMLARRKRKHKPNKMQGRRIRIWGIHDVNKARQEERGRAWKQERELKSDIVEVLPSY